MCLSGDGSAHAKDGTSRRDELREPEYLYGDIRTHVDLGSGSRLPMPSHDPAVQRRIAAVTRFSAEALRSVVSGVPVAVLD